MGKLRIVSDHTHTWRRLNFAINKGDNIVDRKDIPAEAWKRLCELAKPRQVVYEQVLDEDGLPERVETMRQKPYVEIFDADAPASVDYKSLLDMNDHPEAATGDPNHANDLRARVQGAGDHDPVPTHDEGHIGSGYQAAKAEDAANGEGDKGDEPKEPSTTDLDDPGAYATEEAKGGKKKKH